MSALPPWNPQDAPRASKPAVGKVDPLRAEFDRILKEHAIDLGDLISALHLLVALRSAIGLDRNATLTSTLHIAGNVVRAFPFLADDAAAIQQTSRGPVEIATKLRAAWRVRKRAGDLLLDVRELILARALNGHGLSSEECWDIHLEVEGRDVDPCEDDNCVEEASVDEQ
jgi:hypothetical protein